MAEFKKTTTIKQKIKQNKKQTALILLVLLFLLFLLSTTVPVQYIPGAKFVFDILGKPYNSAADLSLARAFYGSSYSASARGANYRNMSGYGSASGGYYDANGNFVPSALGRNLSAISPMNEREIKNPRLINTKQIASQMKKDGQQYPDIDGAYNNPAGKGFASDTALGTDIVRPEDLIPKDIPINPAMLDAQTPTSSLGRVRGGEQIAYYNPASGGHTVGVAKGAGYGKNGRLNGFLDPKGLYRRGRSPLGNLNDSQTDPMGQAGNAWLFSRAGADAELGESKKTLAQAAFDASKLMDDVLLTRGENPRVLSVDDAGFAKKQIDKNREDAEECARIAQEKQGELNQALKDAGAAMEFFTKNPNGKVHCSGTCGGMKESKWKQHLKDAKTACEKYNSLQEQVSSSCATVSGYGRLQKGDCSKIHAGSGGIGELKHDCKWYLEVIDFMSFCNYTVGKSSNVVSKYSQGGFFSEMQSK